ncbi:DNA-binding response regulator [Luteitalea sp. TBR-22]|uniref:response regulator transcription factor n=1 Tax=Luteitalea sp. TBR-22 TaxID=2802971 RepID=UPI001AFC4A8B|nr:response regulator [Luteitalea sp. TBR-22]BCS33118.1 DNA-binding response regulator [Luteitalea sp. TBR-22]
MSEVAVIHVVDDDESLRMALVRLLEALGHEARGYATTGDFLLHLPEDRHGCVLLDVQLPGPSGLELQAGLHGKGVALPVIVMTGHPDVAASVAAMKAGAVDFLTKPIDRAALVEAVGHALRRDTERRAAAGAAAALKRLFEGLSPIERNVFDGIVMGRLNKQIADDLRIAERTVKLHRARLMEKLGVDSAAALGRLAERLAQAGGQ